MMILSHPHFDPRGKVLDFMPGANWSQPGKMERNVSLDGRDVPGCGSWGSPGGRQVRSGQQVLPCHLRWVAIAVPAAKPQHELCKVGALYAAIQFLRQRMLSPNAWLYAG